MHWKKHPILFALLLLTTLASIIPSFSPSLTWSEETPLITHPSVDGGPTIKQLTDGTIWVVWQSLRTGNLELFYKTSTNGGVSWSPDTQLTNHPSNDGSPSIMQAADGKIWIVWTSNRTGNFDIFCMTSATGGSSWSPPTQLTTDPQKDTAPSITQTRDGKIWVVWLSHRTGNDDLFYKTSSDNGLTWSTDAQFTQDIYDDRYPSIMQAKNGTIWVVWASNRVAVQNFEIFYKTSSDDGLSWSPETRLTKDSKGDLFPSITQAADTTIWVVWDSDRISYNGEPQGDLYYRIYNVTWSEDIQFTTNETDDIQPEITQGQTDLFVVWVSSRMGSFDIFFKHAFVPVYDIALTNLNAQNTKVYAGRPLNISFTVKNEGTFTETFDVNFYRDGTLIGTQTVSNLASHQSKTLIFIWDTTDVPVGYTYTISATAVAIPGEFVKDNNSKSDGTVHVKIPGDINGDNTVNVYDAILLSTNFGRPAEEFPDGDINSDGYINVLDAIIIMSNWGETAP